MREKCPYSEFFWSVFSPNVGKYGSEKLRIRTLLRNEKNQQTFGFLTFSCMYRNGTLALIELSRYISTIEFFTLVLLIIYYLLYVS